MWTLDRHIEREQDQEQEQVYINSLIHINLVSFIETVVSLITFHNIQLSRQRVTNQRTLQPLISCLSKINLCFYNDLVQANASCAERGLVVRTPHLHLVGTEAIPGSIPGVLMLFRNFFHGIGLAQAT